MMTAVLLAGGNGSRFASEKPKQFCRLHEKELLAYSLDIIVSIKKIEHVVLVINKAYETEYDVIIERYPQTIYKVEGGNSRQLSVYNALMFMEETLDVTDGQVLIHDSARPFAESVFESVMRDMQSGDAVIPVVPVVDTLYRCVDHVVCDIPPRNEYVRVQTPQGFQFSKLLDCHKKAFGKNDVSYSDDGSLYLKYSGDILKTTEGDQSNFKITRPVDLNIAQYMLENMPF